MISNWNDEIIKISLISNGECIRNIYIYIYIERERERERERESIEE